MNATFLRKIFVLAWVGCVSSATLAADVNWTGGGPDSYWGTGANWSTGFVPTAADNARLTVNGAAVEVPAGESYVTGTFHVAHYANNTLYVAPGATLNGTSGRSYVAREGGQSVGVLTVDGTVNANEISVTGGSGANATIIVNEGGLLTTNLLLFGSWGGGQSGTVVLNGGLLDAGQMGAYLSLCNVTLDLNDGVYDCGYLNPAVLALYDNANGSLLVDIDYGKWIINGDRTADVATLLGRGEIIGFGGAGTIAYDYNVSTPGMTTVTAINPLNPSPEHDSIILTTGGSGTVTLEWDNYIDPNHVGATMKADVWFGTDPNKLNPAAYSKVVNGQVVTTGTRSSSTPQPIVAGNTYYWQVDFDNGNGNIIEGTVLKFLAINNAQPQISIKNVSAWLDGETGEAVILMDATVIDDSAEITYAWTIEPAGDPGVVFDSTAIEDPTLTISSTGVRTLTLTVNDGYWQESAQCQVGVYANPCQAARQTPGYAGDPAGDITGNCVVDLADFSALAQSWLEDSTLNEALYY